MTAINIKPLSLIAMPRCHNCGVSWINSQPVMTETLCILGKKTLFLIAICTQESDHRGNVKIFPCICHSEKWTQFAYKTNIVTLMPVLLQFKSKKYFWNL